MEKGIKKQKHRVLSRLVVRRQHWKLQCYRMLFISVCHILWLMPAAWAQTKAQYKVKKTILAIIKRDFIVADTQCNVLMRQLPAGRLPKSFNNKTNILETSGPEWWCSGFYPGTLIYVYRQTRDKHLLVDADSLLSILKDQQYNKTTHDLGFMMYTSFGNAERMQPNPEYKNILINSAKSLASRFDPKVGCIRSWDSKKGEYLVIIDNMMNLELLFWATRATGDSSYYKIAVSHANTTMKNHFRRDFSSYHVVAYDEQTGKVIKKRTAQGYSDESSWARGQAWGLYGFTMMYRETGLKKYQIMANHIAHYILSNPDMPADKIPYWDYDAPEKPNVLRDASAAAVTASALLELCKYNPAKISNQYIAAAEEIIKRLSSPEYLAEPGTNGGFILKHSVGNMPQGTEIDVPLTYADYYFIEALYRYEHL